MFYIFMKVKSYFMGMAAIYAIHHYDGPPL